MAMIEAVGVGGSSSSPDISFNVGINGQQQKQINKGNSVAVCSSSAVVDSILVPAVVATAAPPPLVITLDDRIDIDCKFHSRTVNSSDTTANTFVVNNNASVRNMEKTSKSVDRPKEESAASKDVPQITLTESTPVEPVKAFIKQSAHAVSSPDLSPRTSPVVRRKRSPTRISSEVVIDLKDTSFRLNQYIIKEPIGSGATSKVYLAENLDDGQKYAVKILSKKKLRKNAGWFGKTHATRKTLSPLEKAYKEISILKKIDHSNVVKLVEVLDNNADDGLYLVFELVEKGEVMKVPTNTPYSENQARSYFRDVVLGLEYLHHQKIIHRDIKPQNLLVAENGSIQIADLGVCSEFEGDKTKMRLSAATPAFTPPEALDPSIQTYCGKALDIWCLGCTLYAFIFGDLPFGSTGAIVETYEKIKKQSVVMDRAPPLSDSLRDLLQKMLTKDPAKRITLPEIKVHSWVTCNGSAPLPSEEENCELVEVSPDEIKNAVKLCPKLDTLILIKVMLRNRSFQNPLTIVHGGLPIYQGDSDTSRSSSMSGGSTEDLSSKTSTKCEDDKIKSEVEKKT